MTRFRSAPTAAAVAAVLMLAACSREQAGDSAALPQANMEKAAAPQAAAEPERMAVVSAAAPAARAAPQPPPAVTGPGVAADAMGSATMTQAAGTRRFIRTAQVEAQVQDVQRAMLRIEDLAARFGGFVTRHDVQTEIGRIERRAIGDARQVELSTYTMRGELQLRVPSDRAQPFLRAIAPELEFLDRRHFEAVDAQFELMRRELARLRHDRAQAALGDATAQGGRLIDRAEAIDRRLAQQAARDEAVVEQRTYEDRVEFATLDLSIRQPERVRRAERPDVDAILRHEGPGFFNRLGEALADGWRGLLGVVVAAASAWPLWLAAVIAMLMLRAWRARRS